MGIYPINFLFFCVYYKIICFSLNLLYSFVLFSFLILTNLKYCCGKSNRISAHGRFCQELIYKYKYKEWNDQNFIQKQFFILLYKVKNHVFRSNFKSRKTSQII